MINIIDYAKGGPITSDVVDMAFAAMPATGCRIVFPPAVISLVRPITLAKAGITLEGECGPHPYPGQAATELHFPPGVPGITVQGACCCVRGLVAASTPLAGSQACGLTILGTRCHVADFTAFRFSQHGILVASGNGNNCNLPCLERSSSIRNGGTGIRIVGNDSNEGELRGVTASGNVGGGFHETDTLGNVYVACHADANGAEPYLIDGGGSSESQLFGCYAEAGQKLSWASQRVTIYGGTWGSDWDLSSRGGMLAATKLSSNGFGLRASSIEALTLAGITAPKTGKTGDFVAIGTIGEMMVGWRCVASDGSRWIQAVITRPVGCNDTDDTLQRVGQ